MSTEMERAERSQSLAIAGQTLAVATQGALLVLGIGGLSWGFATSGFIRCLFGVICLVLGLLALRISSVSFDANKGVVRINARKT